MQHIVPLACYDRLLLLRHVVLKFVKLSDFGDRCVVKICELRLRHNHHLTCCKVQHVLHSQGIFVHVEVAVKSIKRKQVNFFDVCQTEDSQRMRWPLNRVSKQELLEHLEAFVFRGTLAD